MQFVTSAFNVTSRGGMYGLDTMMCVFVGMGSNHVQFCIVCVDVGGYLYVSECYVS